MVTIPTKEYVDNKAIDKTLYNSLTIGAVTTYTDSDLIGAKAIFLTILKQAAYRLTIPITHIDSQLFYLDHVECFCSADFSSGTLRITINGGRALNALLLCQNGGKR